MAQDVKSSNVNPAKNIVKVNILRANVKQTKVIDTDIVFVLEDGRTVFIRDGAVQSLLDNGFSVEFSDGMLVSGQELLQSAGTAEISSIALTGPQASSNDGVIVVQAPQATVASAVEKSSNRSGITTWLAVGTPVVGGVLAGVLGGGGGGSSTTPDNGSVAVKPAMPVINVIANDDNVSATEKAAGVTVTGISDAGASVTVNWGNTTKTVTADSAGRWSANFASTEVPADAVGTTVSATVKSTAGVSSDPAIKTVQVDATSPGVPVIGKVAGDGNISPAEKAVGVSITGTAEVGSTVTVVLGTVRKSVVVEDIDGNWSINYASTELPEQPGTYSVTATARDPSGNISAASAPSTVTVTPAVDVIGQVIAGPLVTSHGLSVSIYRADGTLIVSGVKVNADGNFTAKELPVGLGDVIIAKVVDATPGADYIDETTLLATDLNAELLAVKAVEGTSVTMNINPLTTIAAIKAGLLADGSGTIANAAAATNANKAVAQAFGLQDFGLSVIDITTTAVVATNSNGFSQAGGLSSGERIGAVLAVLSGYDKWKEGNSQTTITELSNNLIVDGSKGLLANQGQVALMRGAILAEDQVDGSLQTLISNTVAEASPTSQVTIGAIATDNIVSANEVSGLTLSGKVSSDVVGVSVVLGTRKVAATISGSEWSYRLSADDLTALGGDGPHIVDAVAELANAATVMSSRLFALRTAPPAIPILAAVSGNNSINAAERDAGISFTGTGDVGSTVILKFGSFIKEVTVDATGAWTIPLLAKDIPTDGRVPVTVSARDPFGNVSVSTIPRLIEIDIVAPNKPTILPVTGDNKISPAEKAAGVKIEGKSEAGATVHLKFGSVERSTTADASGNWFVNLLSTDLPADGIQTFDVTQADVAGNISEPEKGSVTIDGNAPPKPVISLVSTDDRISAAERNLGVTVRGTSEPNAKIDITWGTSTPRSTNASATGSWSVVYTGGQMPGEGTANITATATDSSGNKSAPSDPRTVTIDTSITDVTIDEVTLDNVINATEKSAGVRITGLAEANAEVFVTLGAGGKQERAFADEKGAWYVDFAELFIPADKLETLVTAFAIDQAGNKSREQIHKVDIITSRPAKPTIDGSIATDDIVNAAERSAGVTITGTADAGTEVTVVWGTTGSETTTATDGKWTVTFPSRKINDAGVAEISVTSKNVYGNISEAATTKVTVNATALGKPTIDAVTPDDRVNAEEVANGLTITGTGTRDATINLTWGDITGKTTVKPDGTWAIALGARAPDDGAPELSVTQTDKDGNVSAREFRNITVDRVAPAIPVVIGPISDGTINLAEATQGVTISGTAPVDTKVEVRIGSGAVKEVTSTGAGTWSVKFTKDDLPADGKDLLVAARTLDAANNASAWVSGADGADIKVDIDTSAPPKPVISTIEGDDKINFAELVDGVTVSGTAEQLEPNATVEIIWRVKSSQVERFKRDAVVVDGKWTATFTETEIGDSAELEVVVTAKDLVGNKSEAATRLVEVNNGRPPAPTIDNVTDDDKVNADEAARGLTITGTGVADATISLTWGTVTGGATVKKDGTWEIILGAGVAPAEGKPELSVIQTDKDGIPSLPTSRKIVVDTAPYPVPVVTGPISDGVINLAEANAGVTITGVAPVGAKVEVRIGDGAIKPATLNGIGGWSVTFAKNDLPADGKDLPVLARTIDDVGNASAWSGGAGGVAIPVTIDTTPPPLPTISPMDIEGDNKINANELANGVAITGTGEANAEVTVIWRQKSNDSKITERTFTVDNSGNWTANFTKDDLTFSVDAYIVAIQADAAGNKSAETPRRDVSIITGKPNVPVIDAIPALEDNYLNKAEADLGLTITGTGTPEHTVVVTWGGGTEKEFGPIGQDGKWTVNFTKEEVSNEGNYEITAVQKDALGNESDIVTTDEFFVDTTPPNFPALTGAIGGNFNINITEKNAGVTISGVAPGAAKVDIKMGSSTKLGVAVIDGKWSVPFASGEILDEGKDIKVEGRSYDAAKNVSGWFQMGKVDIDTNAPDAPVIALVSAGEYVNAVEHAAGVQVSGTAEANAFVKVKWGATPERETRADGSGNWFINYTSGQMPGDGNKEGITATQTDVAGNTSAAASKSVEIDLTPPAAPVGVTVAGDNRVNIAEGANGYKITGTGEKDAQVNVSWLGLTLPNNVFVKSDGTWEVDIPGNPSLIQGIRNIDVSQTDKAGNVSASASFPITIDLTAPSNASNIGNIAFDNRINLAEKTAGFTITGTAVDAAKVEFRIEGGLIASTTDIVNGAWTMPVTAAEIPGDGKSIYFTEFRTTDAAGNEGNWMKAQNINIDTIPPNGTLNAVADDNVVNASELGFGLFINGTTDPGTTVRVKWGTTPERTATVDAAGTWQVNNRYFAGELTSAELNNPSTVTVTFTDGSGNQRIVTSNPVTIDLIVPTSVPTLTGMSNDNGVSTADFRTDRNAVALTGTGLIDEMLRVTRDDVTIGTVTVDSFGRWVSPEIKLDSTPPGGSVNVKIRSIDLAGNLNSIGINQAVQKLSAVTNVPTIDVAAMTATTGFTVAGAANEDRIYGLATGDINGDGFKDMIFNSRNTTNIATNGVGAVTVLYGRASWAGTSSYHLANMTNNGWVLQGNINDSLGAGGAGFIGDLNADGFGELIVGARSVDTGSTTDTGAAYIVWGSNAPLGTLVGTRYVLNSNAISDTQGFVFRGLQANEQLGNATLGISSKLNGTTNLNSDFNGDGRADFFIGAQQFDRLAIGAQTAATDVGAVIVIFGRSDINSYGTLNTTTNQKEMTINDLNATNGFIIRGAFENDIAGNSIASAGDVNGDGVTDLLIGARGVNRDGSTNAGAAYVVYGKKTGETWTSLIVDPTSTTGRKILDLGNLRASDGFMIQGESQNGEFGISVEGLGDVNGDGLGDIGIGAPYAVSGTLNTTLGGKAYVIFGHASGQGTTVSGRQVLDVTAMTASQGFIMEGLAPAAVPPEFGSSMGAAGDVNGDGLADIIVTAPGAEKGGIAAVGRSYVIYGKNNGEGWGRTIGTQSILDIRNLVAADGFSISGRILSDNFGGTGFTDSSIIAPGDLNNDGIDDLFIQNPNADTFGRSNNGEAVFVYGVRGQGAPSGLNLGGVAAGAETLNGGGMADILNGAGGADVMRGFAGNDLLLIGDATFALVDGGTGTDTLRMNGSTGFDLNLSTVGTGRIRDIEVIDMRAGAANNNTLTVTEQTLRDLSTTTDILRVLGDADDTVVANGFVTSGTKVENGITYNTYKSGLAELWTQQNVVVNGAVSTPAPVVGFVAPEMSWANNAVLAA